MGESYKDNHYAIIRVSSSGQYLAHKTYQNNFCFSGTPDLFDWKVLPDGTILVAGRCKNGYKYLARVTGFGPPASKPRLNPGNPNGLVPPIADPDILLSEIPKESLPAELLIYDLAGKIIKRLTVKENNINKLQVEIPDCSNGVYVYKLITQGGTVTTRKVIYYR